MADVFQCMVKVCGCCLQAAAYAEPCGCEAHNTLSKIDESEYLTLGNGTSTYSAWQSCDGCYVLGRELFPMGLWRIEA